MLDNASNNGTWMEELEHILSACDISFDTADNRIMYSLSLLLH
jgi:hypothetical protein